MPRQQTLQATVDWSFGLLTASERGTLTRLSVFAGGFDLDAAEAVCVSDAVDALDVLDLIGSLVDKSLVVAEYTSQAVRYRLLETIRQYSAQELLRAAGDDEVLRVRDRHADYYLSLAKIACAELSGRGQATWMRRLDAEWRNLRAAFTHLAAEDRTEDLLRLTVWLIRFTVSRGHADVLGYVRPIIDRTDVPDSGLLAEAMALTGKLLGMLSRTDAGELAAAKAYGERALEMARAVGDSHAEAHALEVLAGAAFITGDDSSANLLSGQVVAIAREHGYSGLLGEALQALAFTTEDAEERRRLYEEAMAIAQRSGDDMLAANGLEIMFALELNAGRIELAGSYMDQAVALAERVGGDLSLHFLHGNLAILRLIQGRHAEVAPLVRKALLFTRRMGAGVALGETIFAAACVAAWQGDLLLAARLFGAGDVEINAALELGTFFWSAAEQSLREREQGRVRELLGDAVYDAAYADGAQLPSAEARDLALGRRG
jgi:tetratricopeptide (TPR) repeat protein